MFVEKTSVSFTKMYLANETVYSDVNECLSLLHDCHQNATCTNTIGSYGCNCDTGFSGNGKQCKSTWRKKMFSLTSRCKFSNKN